MTSDEPLPKIDKNLLRRGRRLGVAHGVTLLILLALMVAVSKIQSPFLYALILIDAVAYIWIALQFNRCPACGRKFNWLPRQELFFKVCPSCKTQLQGGPLSSTDEDVLRSPPPAENNQSTARGLAMAGFWVVGSAGLILSTAVACISYPDQWVYFVGGMLVVLGIMLALLFKSQ
jgi:disulfide bond formation protein DsbB